MHITANPVGCPTCTAFIGKPCTTRTDNLAARPHKARLDADIPHGRHTRDCRAHAIACAAENIAEWDAETRATEGTDPVQVGDEYLNDGTATCLCWSKNTAWATQWITTGRKILDAAPGPYRVYTTLRVDAHGNPLTAEPVRRYAAHDPATAARLAADATMRGTTSFIVDHSEDWPMGGTWTFTPRTGSPIRVRVTVPEAAPTVVGYVTIDATNPNWVPALALSAALDTAESDEPETRTCTACGEAVEFYEGTGWVEVAPDGHYDLCPERYIEATDTQRGHVVAPKPAPLTGGEVRPAISTKGLSRGLEEARTEAWQPYTEQGAEPRSRHALPGTYTV